MRAKTLDEIQNFERGQHPRQALDIGGVQLGAERYKAKKRMLREWNEYLVKLFTGKTVRGEMKKIREDSPITGWGDYEIKVKEVAEQMDMDLPMAVVEAEDGQPYGIPIGDKKIFIG